VAESESGGRVKRPLGRAHAVGKNLEILESREKRLSDCFRCSKEPFLFKTSQKIGGETFCKISPNLSLAALGDFNAFGEKKLGERVSPSSRRPVVAQRRKKNPRESGWGRHFVRRTYLL
jgi:hypothetical protein